jgi:hypothetical protein
MTAMTTPSRSTSTMPWSLRLRLVAAAVTLLAAILNVTAAATGRSPNPTLSGVAGALAAFAAVGLAGSWYMGWSRTRTTSRP